MGPSLEPAAPPIDPPKRLDQHGEDTADHGGNVIRLEVGHLPSSGVDPTAADVDRLWQTFLRRFDIKHAFRLFKQTLGWTCPKVRSPQAADIWAWLILAAHTQLRLARAAAADLRRPWEKPGWHHRHRP